MAAKNGGVMPHMKSKENSSRLFKIGDMSENTRSAINPLGDMSENTRSSINPFAPCNNEARAASMLAYENAPAVKCCTNCS